MIRVLVLIATLFLATGEIRAATVSAADCSSTAVQGAISSATNGDTVRVASSGSATWTSAVSLPSSKFMTLDLNGCSITLSGGSGEFSINAHATGNNRVTNATFIRGSGFDQFSGPFSINDSATGAAVRVDHITFRGSNVIIDMLGKGAGLMDHCNFVGLTFAQEFIHILGWGAGNTTGWTTGVNVGGAGLFYIEDTTFTSATGQGGVAWIQAYYGARVAIRHNTFDHVSVDMHGTAGNVGARWWEVYENTWQNTVQGQSGGWAVSMRAGSGVIFNNKDLDGRYDIGLCEEDSGYPAAYQIGRGINQTSDPAYVWNNPGMALNPDQCDAPETKGMVLLNRDVFASARPGYTAYVYPHPLSSGVSAPPAPPPPPMPPTALSVLP